jgi:hypothetical protein
MPLNLQLDNGIPGKPLPLEGNDESTSSGIVASMTSVFAGSFGVAGIEKGLAAAAGGEHVSYDSAKQQMAAQGYDTAGLPPDGLTSGALDVMMQRQSDIKVNNSIAQRANLGGVTRFLAGLAGGGVDPVNVALLPFGGAIGDVKAGLAGRAALGAATGAAYTAGTMLGSQAIGRTLGDADADSNDNLRSILFGTVLGGGLHASFGARAEAMKPTMPDLRDTIFKSINQAEDATGKGIVTNDSGGVTKFGISQNAHSDVDIKNLTQEKANAILKTQYWDKIDGDNLPTEIQHTAMDAAVNQGVENSKKWLTESEGDPAKFNALREQHYRDLAASNPEKYGKYLPGWLRRLQNVENEPLSAPGEGPRIKSNDQMANNVDDLPGETRMAAGETAVNQFLRDDNVNVEQVINKSLEEQYGPKATTDENQFSANDNNINPETSKSPFVVARKMEDGSVKYGEPGNAHMDLMTDKEIDGPGTVDPKAMGFAEPGGKFLSREEAAAALNQKGRLESVRSQEKVAPSFGRRAQEMQGTDTDLSKAIPKPGAALVKQADLDRIEQVRRTAAAWNKRDAEDAAFSKSLEGPLTSDAKAATNDAVAEAKAFKENIGQGETPKEMQLRVSRKGPDGKIIEGQHGQIHADLYSDTELKNLNPGQYARETGFVTPDGEHLDRQAAQKWVEDHQPGVNEKIDEIKASRGRPDKGNDGLMAEPYHMANDLVNDERSKRTTAFDAMMKDMDEMIGEHEDFANAVEAAVRCGSTLGFE